MFNQSLQESNQRRRISRVFKLTPFVVLLTIWIMGSIFNNNPNVTYSEGNTIPTPVPPPDTKFSISDASQPEGDVDTPMAFIVSRSTNLFDVSVVVDTKNKSAASGSDFDKIAGQVVSFDANGVLEKTVSVNIQGDVVVEGNEKFEVQLSNPTNAAIDGSGTGVGTIENDDFAVVALSLVEDGLAEGDSGLTAYTFFATLDKKVSGGFDLEFTTADGTATAGVDYEANSGVLSFEGDPGESKEITIQAKGDTVVEGDETFEVELGDFLSTDKISSLSTADSPQIATIMDDEVASLTLSAGGSVSEGDSGTTEFVFTAVLSGAVEGGLGVEYTTVDATATVADNDYVEQSGVLLFDGTSGESKTITVEVNGDFLGEANELFELSLGDVISTNVSVAILDSPQVVTILNDDDGVFFIDSANLSISEFETTFPVTVTFSSDLAETVTLDYATTAGSATAGVDFTAVSGSLTFTPGNSVQLIEVPILPDFIVEPAETFTVSISNPSKFGLGNPTSVELTIEDDDTVPELSLASDFIEVSEGESSILVDLLLSQASSAEVSVKVKTTAGTAKKGQDFTNVDTEVSFDPGQVKKTVAIPIIADTVYERNEDLEVTISDSVNATLGDLTEALVKIIEDDPIPTVSISDVTVSESTLGTTNMKFEVTLSSYAAVDIYIDFETSDGGAIAGEDYVANSGRLQIRAGSQQGVISVLIYSDELDETDETFTLNLISSSEGVLGGSEDTLTAVGTIKNTEPVAPATPGTISFLPFVAK